MHIMARPSPSPPTPEDPEHDPVWRLLDRSRTITPSPTFSRSVLTAIHAAPASPQTPHSPLARLAAIPRHFWAAAAIFLAVATLTWLGFARSPGHPQAPTAQSAPARHQPAPASPVAPDESEFLVQSLAAEIAMLDAADQLLDPQDNLDLDESDVDLILF